jgi:hypothetical protein
MKPTQIEFTAEIPTLAACSDPTPSVRIDGLEACIEEARVAALDADPGPAEPTAYRPLLNRLEAARAKLPPLYREFMVEPFVLTLRQLGAANFNLILLSDPERTRIAGLMLDIASAILQQAEGFAAVSTDAFQEVVSDVYDGFLSAEDRQGVNPPDRGVIPPLVKWGHPEFGPYTWPVVSLPPANARQGLVAWSALGHETAGHDILHADTGLPEELAAALQQNLRPLGHDLDHYWSSRIDESASDVLGILNLGPAAGIGLVTYFRALNAAFNGEARLRSEGPASDPHPADILRGYLAAETVRRLKFAGREDWAGVITGETNKDAATIVLAGEVVPADLARQSAVVVAQTLLDHRFRALENHALGEIQNWRDPDEATVERLRAVLRTNSALPEFDSPIYAAHAVAAAVTEALANAEQLPSLFNRMLAMLQVMHEQNPSWGPLFVAHPGNMVRNIYFLPSQITRRIKESPRTLSSTKIARRQRSVPPLKLALPRAHG